MSLPVDDSLYVLELNLELVAVAKGALQQHLDGEG